VQPCYHGCRLEPKAAGVQFVSTFGAFKGHSTQSGGHDAGAHDNSFYRLKMLLLLQPTVQNGAGVRGLLVPGRGGGQRSVMTLAVIKAAASEAR
jgi:hypothetical protein